MSRIWVFCGCTSAKCGAIGSIGCGKMKSAEDHAISARRVSLPISFRLRRKPRARVGKWGMMSAHSPSVRSAPDMAAAATGGASPASNCTKGADLMRPAIALIHSTRFDNATSGSNLRTCSNPALTVSRSSSAGFCARTSTNCCHLADTLTWLSSACRNAVSRRSSKRNSWRSPW